jgi:hypothetical protein
MLLRQTVIGPHIIASLFVVILRPSERSRLDIATYLDVLPVWHTLCQHGILSLCLFLNQIIRIN